ncbi:hypothetical protein, conserved [Leishmania lindenbergi]|uniref:Uncharacterized protein n=1 Tax=Leishmania lindenbergi TaxID=651832 RepID=A0AAW3AS53_9TRYP
MRGAPPPQFDEAAAASDVVVLPSSSEDSPTPAPRLAPAQVAQWTLKDVENHIFFVVWVCGIPVHLRYIVHLLEHSAVNAGGGRDQSPHFGSTKESLTAMAQADVLAPVCRRAAELRQVLFRWPITVTLSGLQSRESFSEVVPLGVLSQVPKHEDDGIRHVEGGECQEDCGSFKLTAPVFSSASCSIIQAGAVTPAERFANVAALALCSPAERGSVSPTSAPSATWCGQAYWTALTQAQQWIAEWPSFSSSSLGHTNSLGGTDATSASSWPPLLPACTLSASRRKHLRGGGAPITDSVVVVDADEGETRESAGGAGSTSSTADDIVPNSKVQLREEAEVVVIDSDEDIL